MKRIYLLVVLFVAFAAQSFAQSDLQITTTWKLRQGGNKLLVSGGPGAYPGYDTFYYAIKNLGPMDLTTADTIYINTRYGTIYCPGTVIKKDSTKSFYNAVNLTPGTGQTKSETIPAQQRCDSIWALTGAAKTVVNDPVIANNKTCNTFVTTYWLTSINDATNVHEMGLFPNPASNSLTLQYNVVAVNSAVVIRNMIGQVVFQKELGRTNGATQQVLDISNLTGGIYVVELNADGKSSIARVVVQK
jgi:hypothetical protein